MSGNEKASEAPGQTVSTENTDRDSISTRVSNNDFVPVKSLEEDATSRTTSQHGSSNELHYEYLTFDTPLPAYLSTPVHSDAPQPPNLKQFDSPFEWSPTYKTIVTILCTVSTWCAAYSAGSYSIASVPIRDEFQVSSLVFNVGVTVWAAGFGIAPMFLAPFSEINGRKPVFIASGLVFLAAQFGCAFTTNFAGMLVSRFFVGASASTFSTIIGGVLSDIFHAQDRNTPMAIYSGGALAGTGFGPFVSGWIVGRASWRWVFYHQLISSGFLLASFVFLLRETRGSVLLSRRAATINKYFTLLESSSSPGHQQYCPPNHKRGLRYKVLADEQRASLRRMIYLSATTPFKLLSTEPVVFFFSLWAAFAWAVLYMTFSVIPLVFTARHGFDTQANGCAFAAVAVGGIVGAIISVYQEKAARRWWPKLTSEPEGRLYFACLESALLPIGLFWFGWTSFSHISWVSPAIALGVAQVGIFSVYLAVFNYLADVYHRYASSALAAQSFCRNMGAAAIPMFATQMFNGLGFAEASSLLGGVGALLTLVPWVLVFHGEKIRRRSRIASEIMETEGAR